MYKIFYNMSATILNDISAPRASPYNLRYPVVSFKMRTVHPAYNGAESLSHLGPKIWSLAPQEIRFYQLLILNQNSKNGLHVIVHADFEKSSHQIGFV